MLGKVIPVTRPAGRVNYAARRVGGWAGREGLAVVCAGVGGADDGVTEA